jgi:hypothetical protein
MISCKNGSHILIMFMVVFYKYLNMKKKTFCRHSKCMKVLHCKGLPMVVMIKKTTTKRQGTIGCNIMVKRSFGEEQFKKKNVKSSSPCRKPQEKVYHLVSIKMQ